MSRTGSGHPRMAHYSTPGTCARVALTSVRLTFSPDTLITSSRRHANRSARLPATRATISPVSAFLARWGSRSLGKDGPGRPLQSAQQGGPFDARVELALPLACGQLDGFSRRDDQQLPGGLGE